MFDLIAVLGSILLVGGILGSTFIVVAWILSLYQICFVQMKEGTAVAIMRAETFHHILMVWHGHRLNDPRRASYNPNVPAWEVLECAASDSNTVPSNYPPWSIWRIPERLGIYWYGLSPFHRIYVYHFNWTEMQPKGDEGYQPRHREEMTWFIYVMAFVYWMKLEGAEDSDAVPIDLEYLLTAIVNNPYIALFRVDDWLATLTAVSNNTAKRYVGGTKFRLLPREDAAAQDGASGFAQAVTGLSSNLQTTPQAAGTREVYGVTVAEVSLQHIAISGSEADRLREATTRRMVAEADALAYNIQTDAEARRIREFGKAEREKVKAFYGAVQKFGRLGELLQQLEALRDAAGAGKTVIWANNPFIRDAGLAELLAATGLSVTEVINLLRGNTPPPA